MILHVYFAGASHYGIGDLEALAGDTHKFESRYIDKLIAPYSGEGIKVYKQRSPINYVDKLKVPIALFQGDEDKVSLLVNWLSGFRHITTLHYYDMIFRILILSPDQSVVIVKIMILTKIIL